jgi:hypothetical protein
VVAWAAALFSADLLMSLPLVAALERLFEQGLGTLHTVMRAAGG